MGYRIGSRRQSRRLIVGSLGIGWGMAALAVLLGQLLVAVRDNRWIAMTPRAVIDDAVLSAVVPGAFRAWLDRPASWRSLHRVVVWFVDEVPLSLCLGGIAMLFTWLALRSERSETGR